VCQCEVKIKAGGHRSEYSNRRSSRSIGPGRDRAQGDRDAGNGIRDPIHIVHALTRKEFLDLGQNLDTDRIREVAANIAAERATDLSVPHETVGPVGEPAERVVSYAEARYIVDAGRKPSPTGKVLFGSKTQSSC